MKILIRSIHDVIYGIIVILDHQNKEVDITFSTM